MTERRLRRLFRWAFVVGVAALAAVTVRTRAAIARHRQTLATVPKPTETFDPADVSDLPAPGRRYLEHAVEPGTPLYRGVRLGLDGDIKLGSRWRPFTAREILAAERGFQWEPRVELAPRLAFTGADYYVDGEGGQRFALAGLFPMLYTTGETVSRSALGRFVGESVWLPTVFHPALGAEWTAIDDDRAAVTVTVDGTAVTVTLTVDDDGALRAVELDRVRDDGTTAPFGVVVDRETTVDGLTVPAELRGGWEFGTDDYDEFYRATVTDVAFY